HALHIYNKSPVFDWDESNLRKIRAHRIKRDEVEQALSNGPIPICQQDVEGKLRYVYYGETDSRRLLAVVLIEHDDQIRVVTAYDLDSGQKRETTLPGGSEGSETMKERTIDIPKFKNSDEEADW